MEYVYNSIKNKKEKQNYEYYSFNLNLIYFIPTKLCINKIV